MKQSVFLVGMLALSGCSFFGSDVKPEAVVVSPNGQNEMRLWTHPLAYEVSRKGEVVVAKTEIGMKINNKALMTGLKGKVTHQKLSGIVPSPVYKKSTVNLAANETAVDFGKWTLRMVARDDGVAYRFETKFTNQVTVTCEKAGLTIDPAAKTYVNYNGRCFRGDPFQNSWESVCQATTARELTTDVEHIAYLPLVYTSEKGTAVCVTESDLREYPGWNLKAEQAWGETHLTGAFAAAPKSLLYGEWSELDRSKRLRYQRVMARHDYLVKTAGTRTYPWRCFLLADDGSKLVESDLVWALATPTKQADTRWIKPGKVAWEWWSAWDNKGEAAGCTTKTYERFIDFAAKNGVEYVIFDEGWSEHLNVWKFHRNVDVPHLIKYANEKNVGIILWMAWAQIVGKEETVAKHFAKLGAKGFKVDFMDRDDAACVNFLRKFADACARNRMVIDYHGMFKPTGMERTFPNVLNFEGIHGLEQMKWFNKRDDFMASDVKSYFVRMSAGPMDYTPGAMDNYSAAEPEKFKGTSVNPGSLGTRCHQMAMMVLYFAPLQMLCDAPTKYERNMECFSFMAKTPVVWDDTVGLKGDPDTMCACARRKGDVWYAAGLNNAEPREYALDTSFLKSGTWKAEIFRDLDEMRDATHYVHETKTIKAGRKIKLPMVAGGGFVVRFTK